MQHVLRAVNAEYDVIRYKTWGCFFPEGYFPTQVTSDQPLFSSLIREVSGDDAAAQVQALLDAMLPLCRGATAVPPAALRAGQAVSSLRVGARAALARAKANGIGFSEAAGIVASSRELMQPFRPLLDRYVTDRFANKFIDTLCFLLAGVGADRIPIAEIAFMFSEWTGGEDGADSEGGLVLEHPVGGSAGIVDALVEAIERGGKSEVRTRAPVEEILLEEGGRGKSGKRSRGVRLKSGEEICATDFVVSNVSLWDMPRLLGKDKAGSSEQMEKLSDKLERLPSFVHLHLAFEATDKFLESLPHELEANYLSIRSWEEAIDAPQNAALISIPSVIDSSCAPSGYHVLHAYSPATEPWDLYAGMDESSEEYKALKEERCQFLWDAVERIIPNAKDIAVVTMTGSPLTHERFLGVSRGSYGPVIDAAKGLQATLPGQVSPVADNLYLVGQTVFPGVGVPAVAASGWLAANSMTDIKTHEDALRRIGLI